MRQTAIVMTMVGILASSCSTGVETTAGDTPASTDTPAVQPTAPAPGTTSPEAPSTSDPASTTSEAASTTTTAATPNEFRFWIAPPEGSYFHVQPLPQPVYGYVRPQARVTVNGLDLDVSAVEDPGQPPDLWRWTTALAGGEGGALLDVALEEGPNVLVFEALLADGSTMRLERTVTYDPMLQRSTGYIVDATPDPPTVMIELATLEYGEFGIEQTGDDTATAEFPVESDALFVVIGGSPPGGDDQFYQGLDLEGLAELAEAAAVGDPMEGYLWQTIYPDGVHSPAAWEFLITAEGRLRQATQFYSP